MTEAEINCLIYDKVFHCKKVDTAAAGTPFTDSLNACALMEAEIAKDAKLASRYTIEIRAVCWRCVETGENTTVPLDFLLITATPMQRCEAALRALGVWEE